MLNENTERALKESEVLLKRLDRVHRFSHKHEITPSRESMILAEAMQKLGDSLPQIDNPQNQDQLLQSELKRRLNGLQ